LTSTTFERGALVDQLRMLPELRIEIRDALFAKAVERGLDGGKILLPQRHARGLEDAAISCLASLERRARVMRGRHVDERADRSSRAAQFIEHGGGVFEQPHRPSVVVHDVQLEVAHLLPVTGGDLHRQPIVRDFDALRREHPEVARALVCGRGQ
jgi:hypothetical protein